MNLLHIQVFHLSSPFAPFDHVLNKGLFLGFYTEFGVVPLVRRRPQGRPPDPDPGARPAAYRLLPNPANFQLEPLPRYEIKSNVNGHDERDRDPIDDEGRRNGVQRVLGHGTGRRFGVFLGPRCAPPGDKRRRDDQEGQQPAAENAHEGLEGRSLYAVFHGLSYSLVQGDSARLLST